MNATQARLQEILQDCLAKRGMPGASIAMLIGDETYAAAAGVANAHTRTPCSTQTVIPFGSVTKTITSTIALRLIEAGELRLDALVRDLVPEYRPISQIHYEEVQLRHLLTHSSGVSPTLFIDTGRNPDALARQMSIINAAPAYHAPGAMLCYSNNGMLLLGRAIEVATKLDWDEAVQEWFARPLGLDTIVTRPEQALRQHAAVGHAYDPASAQWRVEPMPFMFPGHGPAGSTMGGRASDLIALARAYLDGGAFISKEVAELAWTLQQPTLTPGALLGWGLGWQVNDWRGHRVISHDGATFGTKAFLRVIPEEHFALALLVNAPSGIALYDDVSHLILDEFTKVYEPRARDMPVAAMDAIGRCAGVYEDTLLRQEVEITRERAQLRVQPSGGSALHGAKASVFDIHPCGEDSFFVTGAAAVFYPPAGDIACDLVRRFTLTRDPGGAGELLCNGANIYRRIQT